MNWGIEGEAEETAYDRRNRSQHAGMVYVD
jgi:hypothetical protein